MTGRRPAAVLTAFVLGALALAAPPQPAPKPGPPAPADITKAIAQLGDRDFRQREKAGAFLDAAGDAVLDQLQAALASTKDPEVARRLEVLAERLDARRLVAPRLVTLHLKDAPLSDALASITAQTGYQFRVETAPERRPGRGAGQPGDREISDATPVSIDFEGVPFLDALDRLCDGNDLAHFNRDDGGVIEVTGANLIDRHKTHTGIYRVTAARAYSSNGIVLSAQPRNLRLRREPDGIQYGFIVECEPKVELYDVTDVAVTEATDEAGASAVPPAPPPNANAAYSRRRESEGKSYTKPFAVNLVRPTRRSETLAKLRATLTVAVVTKTPLAGKVVGKEHFKGATLRNRLGSVELGESTLAAEGGRLSATVTRHELAEGGEESTTWADDLGHQILVCDAKGRPFAPDEVSVNDRNGRTANITVVVKRPQNRRVGVPAEVRLVDWDIAVQKVPFEMTNLPMP